MRKSLVALVVMITVALASTAGAVTVGGNDIGNKITIFDGMSGSGSWYGTQEDQEVEPGNVTNQSWDLEAFYLKGSKLTMVGGFDFVNGNSGYTSGDIFIDVNGDAKYGPTNVLSGTANGYRNVQNAFGYDYVLDLNFATGKYDVIDLRLGASPVMTTVWYDQNEESNPWKYVSGGTKINSSSMSMSLMSVGMNFDGLLGGYHNLASLDIAFLNGSAFTSHFAEGCGNDNLMGSGTVSVPEPGSMALFGAGLVALAGFRRIMKR